MKKEVQPDAETLQYAIETLERDVGQQIPKKSQEWYEYIRFCAVKSTALLDKQKQETCALRAALQEQKDFIEWMHPGQLYRLYHTLRRQIPFFDPNVEMPEAIGRIADAFGSWPENRKNKFSWSLRRKGKTRAPLK